MPELGRFSRALRARLWKPSVDDEVREEMAYHLELMERDLVASGVPPDEARARARRRFGDVGRIAAECRTTGERRDAERRRGEWRAELAQDVRQAVRQLRNAPRFAVVAILTLAVGLGASTTIFGIANAVMLRPLPYADPDRLVIARELSPAGQPFSISETNYLDWSARQRVFSSLAIFGGRAFTLVGDGDPERLRGALVTHTFFDVLGVPPLAGRGFLAEEDRKGGDTRVVVIAHALWQRRFGGDVRLLGSTIDLDGVRHRLVGIMPPSFDFPDRAEVWAPLAPDPAYHRGDRRNDAVARLRPGVTLEQATRDLARIAGQLAAEYPESNEGWSAEAGHFRRWFVSPSLESRVVALLVIVALLLVMACANVANLLLARAATRQREMAVRATLGAGRWRMARQLLTESAVLCLAGAVAGVAIAAAAAPLIRGVAAGSIPRLADMAVDWRVLAFAVVASGMTGMAFGLAPALRLSRPAGGAGGAGDQLHEALRSGSRVADGGGVRQALVVLSVALAMVLLVGAGLVGSSFRRLMSVDLGFSPERVLLAGVTLPGERYDAERSITFVGEATRRLQAIPGVVRAGATNIAPFGGGNTAMGYVPAERAGERREVYRGASWRVVTPDYFAATSIPLRAGRAFSGEDHISGAEVAVVNEALARQAWPGVSALGRRITLESGRTMTVVGVVGDTRQLVLDSLPVPTVYLAHAQFPWRTMWFTVRTSGDPRLVATAVRRELHALDPLLPVAGLRPMVEQVSDVAAEPRLTMLVFTIFATSALVLAAVGLYGIVSYGVEQRTREIGVQMALGAQSSRVVRRILGEGMWLALAGVAIGTVASYAVARVLRVILYETEPGDPSTYAAVGALLLVVASLASAVPAWRAARLDPVTALRGE